MVKQDAQYLKRTSHSSNTALAGSSVSLSDGTTKHCSYLDDMSVTFKCTQMQGMQVLGSQSNVDSNEAFVDYKYTYKRLVDDGGQWLETPTTQECVERASFVLEDGDWLLLNTRPLHEAAPQA
eukprot:jgi/Chrzof1/3269/Cz12g18160.t1